jgi:hypothetical protein
MRPNINFTSWGREFTHDYYWYPEQNIAFCNIPKCASTAVQKYINSHKELQFEELFSFAIIREPIERLKSALWQINFQTAEDNGFCVNCGYGYKNVSIDTIVKSLKGIECGHNIEKSLLLYLLPQNIFINHFPLEQDIKKYRMDQIDTIFDDVIPKVNVGPNHKIIVREWFSEKFEEDKNIYKNFLNDFYANDFELWSSLQ